MKMNKMMIAAVMLIGICSNVVPSGYVRYSEGSRGIMAQEALFRAVSKKNVDPSEVRKLFSDIAFFNPNFLDKDELSPLFYAIKGVRGDTIREFDLINAELVIATLLDNGANANLRIPGYRNKYPLEIAYELLSGPVRMNIMKLLLQQGKANPNVYSTKNGEGLLYLAARFNQPVIIELLVQNGAEINHQKNNGNTALHEAVQRNNRQAVEALVNLGADKTIQNHRKKTPFDIAFDMEVKGGSTEITDLVRP